MTDLLDVKEASDLLGLNEQTVRRLARDGQIPAFKFGGSWRFRRELLDAQPLASELKREHQSVHAKVLIIDDDPTVVRIMKEILETEGHQIYMCFNGEKVIEATHGEIPDLIFLDLQMPLCSGPQTLKIILEQWGSIETVILTAFPDSQLMKEVMDLASVRLLKKPPDLEKVIELAFRAARKKHEFEI